MSSIISFHYFLRCFLLCIASFLLLGVDIFKICKPESSRITTNICSLNLNEMGNHQGLVENWVDRFWTFNFIAGPKLVHFHFINRLLEEIYFWSLDRYKQYCKSVNTQLWEFYTYKVNFECHRWSVFHDSVTEASGTWYKGTIDYHFISSYDRWSFNILTKMMQKIRYLITGGSIFQQDRYEKAHLYICMPFWIYGEIFAEDPGYMLPLVTWVLAAILLQHRNIDMCCAV